MVSAPNMLLLKIITVLCTSTLISGYTITSMQMPVFPSQLGIADDTNSFIRTYTPQDSEIISCPFGYQFNEKLMKCLKVGGDEVQETDDCPSDLRGQIRYVLNCRKYIDCWDGVGYILDCPAHLTFNSKQGRCDYPEQARCCEYVGENPLLLV